MEYHYDPLSRRLAKVGAEGVVFYGWDGDTLAFETHSTGAIHYLFEPASFTPLAQVHTAPIEGLRVPAWGAHIPYDPEADPLRAPPPEPEPPRAIFYYHTDHLGTPQLLTDAAGQQALEMEYQAWGAAREILTQAAQSAGLRNPLRFQGQYHDDESGLHYNRYRYYDPDTGRFISRDPIGLLGGMNVHTYAPNPVEWVDPLGLWGVNPIVKYKYNENGSLKSVTAKIRQSDLGTGSGTNESSRKFARQMGCAKDDAGHAAGSRLGGSGGKGNIFPQTPSVNRGKFRDFENQVAREVEKGKSVVIRVVPDYGVSATRPDSVLYQARIDGVTHTRRFDNPCPCDCG